ncbi:MAG: hypothetical protein GMKNLPBB_00682 [Myxococcota bacterium]|nr:hypothetical protein [Myxococcota bacterium]
MPHLTYLGGTTFLVEHHDTRIVIDPSFRGNPARLPCPDRINWFVTPHLTSAGADELRELARGHGAGVITTHAIAAYLRYRGSQGVDAIGRGAERVYPWGRISFTHAGYGVAFKDDEGFRTLGDSVGCIIEMGGAALFYAGLASLHLDLTLLGEFRNLEVGIFPIGGVDCMNVMEALRAVEFVRPRRAVPMYFQPPGQPPVDPQLFLTGMVGSKSTAKLLAPGESMEY